MTLTKREQFERPIELRNRSVWKQADYHAGFDHCGQNDRALLRD
jgi:hypothetical protein